MRPVVPAALIVLSFLLGAVVRGEADDADARPTDAEVETWVAAIQVSRGPHERDLVRKLVREADRAVPRMYALIQEQARLQHTLTVFEVGDVRDAIRARFGELESLLTQPSIQWIGDDRLAVRANRLDAERVGALLDRIRREASQ